VQVAEGHVAHKFDRVFEGPLILAWEPHDKVGAKTKVRNPVHGVVDGPAEGGDIVAASHGRQHADVAAL
jgi:hypothetical protein